MGFETPAAETQNNSPSEDVLHSIEDIFRDERMSAVSEAVKQLDQFFHQHNLRQGSFDEVSNLIEKNPQLFVRRESAEKITELVSGERAAINLRQNAHDGVPYPNAAVFGRDAQGIAAPLMAGFESLGDGRVVLLTGFAPTASLLQKPFSTEKFAHYQKQIPYMRAIEGGYSLDNLAFVGVRFAHDPTTKETQFGEGYVWHGSDFAEELGLNENEVGGDQFDYCFYVLDRGSRV